jgi:hypothetical protein
MKRIFSILAISCFIVLISSCNQNNNKTKINTVETKQIKYSSIDEIFTQSVSLSNKTVNVKGIIEHVCEHTWKRFKIIDPNGKLELKIELGDNFPSVDASIIGLPVKVTGKLIPVKMDEEMVLEWEQKMKENHKGEENTEHYKEELAAIQAIHAKMISGEISYYTTYTVEAEKYELE